MLCFAKDRLYLVERYCDEGEEEEEEGGTSELRGRRILVLSLQGDILQVVTHPTELTAQFGLICCFDGKLLASYSYYTESAGTGSVKYDLLALQGL